MTYDPVDANDDGIVESDVDNQSVNTEQTKNEIGSDGTTTAFEQRPTDSTDEGVIGVYQKTQGVGTTATKIINERPTNTSIQALGTKVAVSGVDQDVFGNRFLDVVIFDTGGDVSVLGSVTDATDSAASRSYSVENNHELHLAMGSGTYNITAQGVCLSP